MNLTHKITVQEKIAELEGRMVKLESGRTERRTINDGHGSHWTEMWRHFDALLDEIFSGPKKKGTKK